MTYLSVCSGIEAASAAWEPLGWQAAGFSEIDPFACAVLAHRFPETENYGDMTDFRTWDIAMFDVLVGGTPCQSFSVAGSRKGLTDPRGKLVYTFLEMVEHYRPKYVVWENVPGVLSDKTGVFRLFYTRLQDTGYLCDADILDAADFGVPQRRTRLFVVGINADYILGEHHEAQENRCDGNRSYPRDKFEQARHTYTDTLDSARAFTGGMEGERWTEGVYNAGGLAFCDAVDFHYYTARKNGYPGDGVESMFRTAFAPLLKKDGKIGKEVYMSEGQGASTGGVSGDRSMRYAGLYHHTVPWNNREDYHSIAESNIRYLISLLSLGVKRVFFYAAHSYSDFSAAPNFLFLFCADGSPHPMFVAHAAFAERVENMSFVKVREIKKGVFAYFFSDHRKSLAAVSSRFLEKECSINCDLKECKVADLYGNPVGLPVVYRGLMLYFEAPVPLERLEAALAAGTR